MDAKTIGQLNRIYAAVEMLSNEEGQDQTLVIEMSQQMLNDLIENGRINEMNTYIRRYADIFDSQEDADEFAAGI